MSLRASFLIPLIVPSSSTPKSIVPPSAFKNAQIVSKASLGKSALAFLNSIFWFSPVDINFLICSNISHTI